MAASYIRLPADSTGKKVQSWENTVGSDDVHTQASVVSHTDGAELTTASGLRIVGGAASDAAVAGNPLLAGARASTAAPSDVSADGDAVALWARRSGALVIDGNVANAATDAGNPLKVGAVYKIAPAVLTDGQRGDLQVGTRGSLKVQLMPSDNGNPMDVSSVGDLASFSTGIQVQGFLMGYNGATWDRVRTANTGRLQVDIVTAASTAVTNTGTFAVQATLAAETTKVIGTVNLAAGTNNIGDVDVLSLPALAAGTNNIGDVDVLTLPGTFAEDVGHTTADTGHFVLAVRNDADTVRTNTDGDYSPFAVDSVGRTKVILPATLPKSIQVSGSLGITTAATWDERAAWAVPANYAFKPKVARAAVTTAATRTLILSGRRLGTWNPGTNTFTDDQAVSAPDFFDRLFYRINVTHSATATTVTVTYTDQDGNTGATTTGLVIPSAAVAGDWYEFVLAAGDFGVRDVTAVSDTANPTSVTDEIWGVRTLLEGIGPAAAPEFSNLGEGVQLPSTETIFILFNAAATTAQVRFASVLGDLVPV